MDNLLAPISYSGESIFLADITPEQYLCLDRVSRYFLLLKGKRPEGVSDENIFDMYVRCHTQQRKICDECTPMPEWTSLDRMYGLNLGHHSECSKLAEAMSNCGLQDYMPNQEIAEAK